MLLKIQLCKAEHVWVAPAIINNFNFNKTIYNQTAQYIKTLHVSLCRNEIFTLVSRYIIFGHCLLLSFQTTFLFWLLLTVYNDQWCPEWEKENRNQEFYKQTAARSFRDISHLCKLVLCCAHSFNWEKAKQYSILDKENIFVRKQ